MADLKRTNSPQDESAVVDLRRSGQQSGNANPTPTLERDADSDT